MQRVLRALSVVLGLVIAVSLTGPAAAQVSAEPAGASLEGWLPVMDGSGKTLYALPVAPYGSMARVWFRMEDPTGEKAPGAKNPTFSMVILQEFDCARRRSRALQGTSYSRPGLVGEREFLLDAPEPWEAIVADSMHARAFDKVCDGGTPRPPLGDAEDPSGALAFFAVEAMGWIEVSRDVEGATFVLPGPKGEFARVWLRTELRLPAKNGLSLAQLYEMDCAQGRMRVIQSTSYLQNNLIGENETDAEVRPWSFLVPGTAGDFIHRSACGLDDDAPVAAPAAAPAPAALNL